MKRREPPRLALRILERFAPEDAPLAGDLVEEFHDGRSAAWFWRQVLAAIWTGALRPPGDVRPLRLVDLQPADASERSRRLIVRFRPINLTASPVAGVGGLGLLMLSLLISLVVPAVWLALAGSMITGVLLGLARIAIRRRRAG